MVSAMSSEKSGNLDFAEVDELRRGLDYFEFLIGNARCTPNLPPLVAQQSRSGIWPSLQETCLDFHA